MNLHGIVSGAIGAVNPLITIFIKRSTGYETAADGNQTPVYCMVSGPGQRQALSGREIERLNNLGIQGQLCAVYLSGDWQGIVRADSKGGDIFLMGCETWLAVQVLETWPDWSKVALVRQLDTCQ